MCGFPCLSGSLLPPTSYPSPPYLPLLGVGDGFLPGPQSSLPPRSGQSPTKPSSQASSYFFSGGNAFLYGPPYGTGRMSFASQWPWPSYSRPLAQPHTLGLAGPYSYGSGTPSSGASVAHRPMCSRSVLPRRCQMKLHMASISPRYSAWTGSERFCITVARSSPENKLYSLLAFWKWKAEFQATGTSCVTEQE